MTGAQCDTCRKFAAGQYPPDGWIVIGRYCYTDMTFSALLGSNPLELEGTFCSRPCAVNWLYAKIAIPEGGT